MIWIFVDEAVAIIVLAVTDFATRARRAFAVKNARGAAKTTGCTHTAVVADRSPTVEVDRRVSAIRQWEACASAARISVVDDAIAVIVHVVTRFNARIGARAVAPNTSDARLGTNAT